MRMMCAHVKADAEDVKYDIRKKNKGGWVSPEWEVDKPKLLAHNPFVSLPYVVNHTTGEVVSTSLSVYLYMGRLFGLNGKTAVEQMANEQVLSQANLLWVELLDLVYPKGQDESAFTEGLGLHFKKKLPAQYEKLDKWLRHRGTDFFVGHAPCTADFSVWEVLDQYEIMSLRYGFSSPLGDFAALQAFHKRFRAMPSLHGYFDSEDSKLPMNNKNAYFQ